MPNMLFQNSLYFFTFKKYDIRDGQNSNYCASKYYCYWKANDIANSVINCESGLYKN